jgi:hypothetical protein
VASNEQKSLSGLGELAKFAAVVGGRRTLITMVGEELLDLIDKVCPAGLDARYVLEQYEFGRIVRPSLQAQLDSAKSECIESLVFRRQRLCFGKKSGKSLTGHGRENDVWTLISRRAMYVCGGGLAPAWLRGSAVIGDVLLESEYVQGGQRCAREACKIAAGGRVVIKPADAAVFGLQETDSNAGRVEPACAATKSSAGVKVTDLNGIAEGQMQGRVGTSHRAPEK